jgi:hypothetical protein
MSDEATPPPKPGDPVVCIKCASVNTPDENERLRQMSRTELNALPMSIQLEVRRIQEAIFAMKRKTAANN